MAAAAAGGGGGDGTGTGTGAEGGTGSEAGAAAGAARALQAAMKLANGALELDSGGRAREAYGEYLRAIAFIARALHDGTAAAGAAALAPDTPRMLKLAEQCLERVKSIAAALGSAEAPAAAPGRSAGPGGRHRRVCSDEGAKLSPFLPPELFQRLQLAEARGARRELSPLEEASLQNQKLKAAYEARLARLHPRQALQKTSLTLSLQRQMMENLVIAKAREETLQRRMEERRQRLQEAANRRFCGSAALTPEEQEQRALYAAVLEYEQDHDWPRQWKAKLKRSPADPAVVAGLFACLLSCPEHPVAQLLRRLQCSVYGRLYPAVSQPDGAGPAPEAPRAEPGGRRLRASRSLHCMVPERGADALPPGPAPPRDGSFEDLERFLASPEGCPAPPPPPGPPALQEQLKGVVRDIHDAIDRLLALALLAFEGLCREQSQACIEEAFFPPLWPPLLALYRRVLRAREAALSRSMERYRHAGPGELGLAPRLCPAAPHGPAYGAAVADLRLVALETCPQRKLECIVRALRVICECAEEYCGSGSGPAIGADDLLPILSFVVLRSGLPQLAAECAALEEFIPEGFLIGEEGYCLTSLQSALAYVESLP